MKNKRTVSPVLVKVSLFALFNDADALPITLLNNNPDAILVTVYDKNAHPMDCNRLGQFLRPMRASGSPETAKQCGRSRLRKLTVPGLPGLN
jgi:hypothetical protein